ncbi:hypothetical protein MOBT1_003033 [Malassezia obtusa]|uniref:Uncharacterized protein n=1 Tax=Malassezia obtusa TaxID=76774 RepID=A0AAF0IXP8_9BASI|nr:hypothetical protein MOBT1_003033 [Malassezia obtusa]
MRCASPAASDSTLVAPAHAAALARLLAHPAVWLTRDFRASQWYVRGSRRRDDMAGVQYALAAPDGTRVATLAYRGRKAHCALLVSTDRTPLAHLDLRSGHQGFAHVFAYAPGTDALRFAGEVRNDLLAFRAKYTVLCTPPHGAARVFGRLTVKAAGTRLHLVDDHKTRLATIHSVPFALHAPRPWDPYRFKVAFGAESTDERLVTLALAFLLDYLQWPANFVYGFA